MIQSAWITSWTEDESSYRRKNPQGRFSAPGSTRTDTVWLQVTVFVRVSFLLLFFCGKHNSCVINNKLTVNLATTLIAATSHHLHPAANELDVSTQRCSLTDDHHTDARPAHSPQAKDGFPTISPSWKVWLWENKGCDYLQTTSNTDCIISDWCSAHIWTLFPLGIVRRISESCHLSPKKGHRHVPPRGRSLLWTQEYNISSAVRLFYIFTLPFHY